MKVLISAYACEPGKGSEPGAGWQWVVAAAREHDVCVLTRANNRSAIEAGLANDRTVRARFVYLDLPRWARFWKRGGRGVRLYYMMWQLLAACRARQLNRVERFDVVHHLTFANVWLPALTCVTGPPFLLGPVGGGPRVPLRLYRALGMRGAAREIMLLAARRGSRWIPLVRMAWRRSYRILVQNQETLEALPDAFREKGVIRPNPASDIDGTQTAQNSSPEAGPPNVVCAGRLLPWKGVTLAITMMDYLPSWELTIVGDGPDRDRLKRVAERHGVAGRVQFLPWLPQEELWALLKASRCLVLPSLREDGSLMVAESQALGVPVVAFDHGGPRVLARRPGAAIALVPFGESPEASARKLADAVLHVDATRPTPANPDLGVEGIVRDLSAAYADALCVSGASVKLER